MSPGIRTEGTDNCLAAHLDPQRGLVSDINTFEGSCVSPLEALETFRDRILDEDTTSIRLPEGDLHGLEGPLPCSLCRDVRLLGDVVMRPSLATEIASL